MEECETPVDDAQFFMVGNVGPSVRSCPFERRSSLSYCYVADTTPSVTGDLVWIDAFRRAQTVRKTLTNLVRNKAPWLFEFVSGHRPDGTTTTKDHVKFSPILDGVRNATTLLQWDDCEESDDLIWILRCQGSSLQWNREKFQGIAGNRFTHPYMADSRIWHTVTPAQIPELRYPAQRIDFIHRSMDYNPDIAKITLEPKGVYPWSPPARAVDTFGMFVPVQGTDFVHVSVEFTHPVSGPIFTGQGRYKGFGIMEPVFALKESGNCASQDRYAITS